MLKKIIFLFLLFFSLIFISCYSNDKNEQREVEEIVKLREKENIIVEEKNKEVEIKKKEKEYFEKIINYFEKGKNENLIFLEIENDNCTLKSKVYEEGNRLTKREYYYSGRIIDDIEKENKLLEIAKKYNYFLYSAEEEWGSPDPKKNNRNYNGDFKIYKIYIFKRKEGKNEI